MKLKNLACIASLLVASLSGANAATTLTSWNFDAFGTGTVPSPATSFGFGTASVIGFGGSSTPTIVSQSGSSTGGAFAWSIGNTGGSSVGWSTNAAIGTQGAKFNASTLGYYQIKVSFDVYAQSHSESALMVQYSQDGLYWQNANITSAGSAGVLATNTTTQPNPTNGVVFGASYVKLGAGWNNGVTVDLTGVPGVANDPNFTIRIVNAATGSNCVDTTGAPYVTATGNDWTLDNVTFSGISFDTVADWTFENIAVAKHINSPIPAISNNTAIAKCIGFGTPANPELYFAFSGLSTNDADVTTSGNPYPSTGPAGQNVWRLRGQPGNGWCSTNVIGSQGAEFDVSTVNYTNIILTFDLYFTTQGEARMCVLYATDGVNFTNTANLACSSYPTLIQTNSEVVVGSTTNDLNTETGIFDPNIVNGVFIDNTIGSLFYNYMSVDLTGLPNVGNNPHFAFRVVNAATGNSCVNFLKQAYNNNSGNARIDNVAISGQFAGQPAPLLTSAVYATVDLPFTNTFTESVANNDMGWHTNIYSVYVNGLLVPKTNTYPFVTGSPGSYVTNKLVSTNYIVSSSSIIFFPSTNAPVLAVSGFDNIVIFATNYTTAKVVQFVNTGVAAKFAFTQPAAPTASGGTLTVNPVFSVTDQFGNGTTNPYINMQVTATASNSTAWTLGGSTIQAINSSGSCVFTDLTATVTGTTATNAMILFSVTGGPLTGTNSIGFTIGAPPGKFTQGNLAVLQVDTKNNNSTFSIVEIQPSVAGQTNPVNINPITATGANALRMTAGGGSGHLALSDDGTFLVFGAYDDGSSATVDETFNLNRAVGTMDANNNYTKTGKYVSNSLGGSSVRAVCSPDNVDFLIDDKGGLYVYETGNPQDPTPNVYEQNNYTVRSFGTAAWVQTQKIVAGLPGPSVFQFNNGTVGSLDYYASGNDGQKSTGSATPPPDGVAVDFYMISTNGSQDPLSFAILYTIENNGGLGTNGVVSKFLRNSDDSWTAIGTWTNIDNCNTLFATTNGSGGVYLYYANGTTANSIIRLTDSSLMGSLNIVSTNTIYTAPTGATAIGITFVPVTSSYLTALMPPPILTAQTPAPVNNVIYVTNTPDDSLWRNSITSVTVNGAPLPSSAVITNRAGFIGFDISKSSLLQTNGTKTIAISAAGYSTNFVTQAITIGAPSKLVVSTEPSLTVAAGAIFATQPVVYVEDANGNLVLTNNSSVVTATVGTGTGPLTGTLTATAVNGVATFNNLAAPTTAQTGLKLTYTSSGLTPAVDATSLTVQAVVITPINITPGLVSLNGGKFQLGFTNATGLSFSVLATNNVAAPKSTWPVVGTAIENPPYHYSYTNTAATNANLFYILRQP